MAAPEQEKIRKFISGHVHGAQIDDDEDLFDSGYVNSLFAVQLVMWIERTLGIPVQRGDLDLANFRSISAIAAFVEGKKAATTGGVSPGA